MKFKKLFISLAACAMFSTTAFAGNFVVEGEMKTVIANPAFNINPWNTITVSGVGNDGTLKLFATDGIIEVPLGYPLYRINDYYCDKIVCKNGVWGIERNVAIKTFNGSENWEVFEKQSFQNDNTIIFRCDKDFDTDIENGVCSHFDVHTYESQRENIYDGISFDENGSGVLMRLMNVRNIKTVDDLKEYLSKAGVRFYYPATEQTFEPFDTSLQLKLKKAATGSVGYSDPLLNGITEEKTYAPNSEFFMSGTTGNSDLDIFLSAVKSLEIYNGGTKNFYIQSVDVKDRGFEIVIADSAGGKYSCDISYDKYDFLTEKTSELRFTGNGNTVIKMHVNLDEVKAFSKDIKGLTASRTAIKETCKKEAQAVLPGVVYASKGTTLDFNNAILYGNEGKTDKIEVYTSDGKQLSKNGVYTFDGADKTVYSFINGKRVYFDIKSAPKTEDKTILFMGDSIINQNYYTKYFNEIYGGSIKTIGTLGEDGNKHEGRGGWSAWDYCTAQSKYGYTNPFLNEGKFDFGYYMKKTGFEAPDAVVINLGINDLNTVGHNSHEEILSYFDQIVESILFYNENIKIVINAPEITFRSESTNSAANTRLNFAKDLFEHFKDSENVTIALAYLNLNGQEDFKYEEPVISEDNQNYAMTVSDTTHPNISGYEHLAQGTADVINYIFK